ncbi:MAG: HEAT repeat domain-containing protein [Planctomycetota bacterium]
MSPIGLSSVRRATCVAIALMIASPADQAAAVTPQSPEVRALVKRGLDALTAKGDVRLGGKCVVALAFLKDLEPQPSHPRVAEALEACVEASRSSNPLGAIDMYSNGLAIIFLCELGAKKHQTLIQFYQNLMKRRQKQHGGWGYEGKKTGDTSQTQYAAFSLWEAHQNGVSVPAETVAGMADWIVHTQDPSGAWGYQGKFSKEERAEQEEITQSMVAAAMGSGLIALDLFGLLEPGTVKTDGRPRSSALKIAGQRERKRAPTLRSASFNSTELLAALKDGDTWFDKNYKIDIGTYTAYYLYSMERYKSFQERLRGTREKEPSWYVDGYKWFKKKQREDGSWQAGCGTAPDTAFAILFLVRSTQQILNKPVGDLRIGRRGFPKPSVNAEFVRGQFVIKQTEAALGDLLDSLDGDTSAKIDEMVNNPNALVITGEVDEAAAARLQQLVRSGSPGARRLAVRTLGRTGDLDHVPTLIFALTDPDEQVTLEARDALRFVSRRFEGFGLKPGFDREQRYTVIERWTRWYLSIRPDATVSIK